MTPVVIDASAGAELVADTVQGRALRRLLPADAEPWVPDLFYGECGSVLRKWDLLGSFPPGRLAQALTELASWPLHVAQTKGLLSEAWRQRHNLSFPDATYVALALHVGGPILTDDRRMANAPNLPVQALHLAIDTARTSSPNR